MIEANWSGTEVRGFSLFQLVWALRGMKRRRAERDRMALLIAVAGSACGEAAQRLYRTIDQEIKDFSDERRTQESEPQEESRMPLSTEEFRKWMKEHGAKD